MDAEDTLLRLDRRLDELQSLARHLHFEDSARRTARLRALLTHLVQMQEEQPPAVPEQRAP